MSEITPIFTRLDHKLFYDTSVEQSEIYEIQCDSSSIANLNQQTHSCNFIMQQTSGI